MFGKEIICLCYGIVAGIGNGRSVYGSNDFLAGLTVCICLSLGNGSFGHGINASQDTSQNQRDDAKNNRIDHKRAFFFLTTH